MKIKLQIICLLTLAVLTMQAKGLKPVQVADTTNTLSIAPANTQLKLPGIFSNDMVIQREKPVTVWGTTVPRQKVTVQLHEQKKSVKADAYGNWRVRLKPLPVGGPYEMIVSTPETSVKYKNILSGDVWFCSGQSNMEFQLQYEQNADSEIPVSANPNIRMIRIPHNVSTIASNKEFGRTYWLPCNPSSSKLFSAVGYYFGKKIQAETNVPIGLIGSYWGGSAVESWMSKEALEAFPVFDPQLKEIEEGKISIQDMKKRFETETNRRLAVIKEKKNPNTVPYTPYAFQHYPSFTFNGMVSPFTDFAIKGVIWYQAENNASRAHQYADLFKAMINDWRKQWKDAKLPFYFVQLPNYGLVRNIPYVSQWAELRESQTKALKLPNTGMAVTIDVGGCKDLHPKNKLDVGNRLASIALNQTYGEKDIAFRSPMIKSFTIKDNTIICEFDYVGSGLQIIGGELTEFCIAGENKRFYNATAKIITPNQVEISAPEVKNPVAVRYAWSNCPVNGLLFNSDNLPASPFRTDDWQISTQGVY